MISAFGIVQIFLSCLHATLFVVQLPWTGSRTPKNAFFSLINIVIATMISSSPFWYLFASANLVAISISAGGIWLRRDKKSSCECFGVMNDEFGKRGNTIGFAIIAANLLALAASAVMSRAGEERLPIISPQVCSGVLLFLIAFVGVRAQHMKALPGARAGGAKLGAGFNPNEPVRITVPADMVLGHDQQNAPRTLANVRQVDRQFGLLIASDGCQPCALLKRDIAALRDVVYVPLCVIDGSPGPALKPHSLHDHDKKLRQLASVVATPCLLMLDAGDAAITRKVHGLESIRAALLELIAQSPPMTQAAGKPAPDVTESLS